jgi:hypothetical protein
LFINTSGSGKTRLLLDGLCKNWGFYFSCAYRIGDLGSTDLAGALSGLCRSPSFKEIASSPQDDKLNRSIARHMFKAVLASRIIIFKFFRKLAKIASVDETEQKRLWVLLQIRPKSLLSLDIFHILAMHLCRAPSAFVAVQIAEGWRAIRLDTKVVPYSVLDEAQVAAKMYPQACLSRHNSDDKRSILSELIGMFHDEELSLVTPLIISGTGLQKDIIEEYVLSGSAKSQAVTATFQRTGSFHREEDQAAYITQYLWPGKRLDEGAKRLLRRAWRWLRGRCALRHSADDLYAKSLSDIESPPVSSS